MPVVEGRVVAGRLRASARRVRAGVLALRPSRAIALRPDGAIARRAALVGLAFGVGFQLSRLLQSRRVTDAVTVARGAVRPSARDGAERGGAGTARRVRRSITVLSMVYGIVERRRS